MKRCSYCGAQNENNSVFCTECGKEFHKGLVCPNCGTSLEAGDTFCSNCGKSIIERPKLAEHRCQKNKKSSLEYRTIRILLLSFFALFVVIILTMYGAMLGLSAQGEAGMMVSVMPIIMLIDYLLHFIVKTKSIKLVEAYIQQPILRHKDIERILLSSHLSGYNLLLLVLFIPYSCIILMAGSGFWAVLLELITCELLIILNSQIYLFWRILINQNVLWTIPALGIYILPFIPIISSFDEMAFLRILDTYKVVGMEWYFLLLLLFVLVVLFYANRHLLFRRKTDYDRLFVT